MSKRLKVEDFEAVKEEEKRSCKGCFFNATRTDCTGYGLTPYYVEFSSKLIKLQSGDSCDGIIFKRKTKKP